MSAAYLARILRERGVVVIETYPRAVFRRRGSTRRPAGTRLPHGEHSPTGSATLRPDELDAIAAALAAAECATRAIDGADGTIWRVGA